MKSVMTKEFGSVPNVQLQRSKFNRSHGHKTTFDMGYLIPVFIDEALPGDTFNLSASFFARLATCEVPIMDNMYLDSFFFAVPYRLVWDKWVRFMGERINPTASIDFTIPVLDHTKSDLAATGFTAASVYDYMGLPTEVVALENVSALPLRAHNLIYNEWFRSNDLITPKEVNADSDGPDDDADYELYKRGKRHDYFTSCLPWAQRGDAVMIPLGTTIPVTGDGNQITMHTATDSELMKTTAGGAAKTIESTNAWTGGEALKFGNASGNNTGLETDLSDATEATIVALREAFQIQKLLERDARGGNRYIELIKSHFGVTSPDARMQRPEYLGGGRAYINIHPVIQTSQTDTTPQGTITAIGTMSADGHGFTKSFTEHSIVIGYVCVTADLSYQKGLDRMWSRSTRYDFYWPSLANLGEQAVLNKEIYCDAGVNDDATFGYQERYAEYRYKNSMITGRYRSNHATSLDAWHLSQDFGVLPTLGETFINENVPTRFEAAPTDPDILFDSYFRLICVRPMPVYSVPGLADHF